MRLISIVTAATLCTYLPASFKKGPMRTKTMKTMKIMMLGDSNVGKSSIISRYAEEIFSGQYIETIGIDYKKRTIELRGQEVILQLWDTAGHERFHSITRPYYRKADGIMLVYDITKDESFHHIGYWLRSMNEHSNENVKKMIIGNKCDLTDKRMISKERGEAIGKEHNIPFLETSAKANTNIDAAFLALAEAIVDREQPDAASSIASAIVIERTKRRRSRRCWFNS